MVKFNEQWAEKGFEAKSVEMMVRKNGRWVQVVIMGKDGKEKLFIMQEVKELLDIRKRESEW